MRQKKALGQRSLKCSGDYLEHFILGVVTEIDSLSFSERNGDWNENRKPRV